MEQSFALVAVLNDVPVNFACFQKSGSNDCFGRTGATEVSIVDNDGMLYKYSVLGECLVFLVSRSNPTVRRWTEAEPVYVNTEFCGSPVQIIGGSKLFMDW